MENRNEKQVKRITNFLSFIMSVFVSSILLLLWVLVSGGVLALVLKKPLEIKFDFEMILYFVILVYLFAGNLRLSSQVKALEEKILKRS